MLKRLSSKIQPKSNFFDTKEWCYNCYRDVLKYTHNSNESSHVLCRLISGDNFNNDMEISDTNTLL